MAAIHMTSMKVRKILLPSIFCIVLVVLVLVVRNYNLQREGALIEALADHSFLTDQPCAAPCWYNITPGQTIEKEKIVSILKNLPFIDPSTIGEGPGEWQGDFTAREIGYRCNVPDISKKVDCGGITILNGRVVEIIRLFGKDLTLDKVIHKLGAPRFVNYMYVGMDLINGGCDIHLIWPEKGIVGAGNSKDEVCRGLNAYKGLPQTLIVNEFTYTEPGSDRRVSSLECNYDPCVSWPGYSDLK
jgi:hypothetical protein